MVHHDAREIIDRAANVNEEDLSSTDKAIIAEAWETLNEDFGIREIIEDAIENDN
jgi:uncharacterized protein (DUF1778 family)